MGKKQESDEAMAKAMTMADETQLNNYGYLLMNSGEMKLSQEIFEMNIKKYPGSWNVYDSLGENLANQGMKSEALKQYKTALAKAPENQKLRIKNIIDNLEKN
jgi:Tfp pilus assembly protein PilF